MKRRARDSVAPLRHNPAGWMSVWIGRLSAGVGGGCEHCDTQAVTQYSAVEWSRDQVAVRNVVALTP